MCSIEIFKLIVATRLRDISLEMGAARPPGPPTDPVDRLLAAVAFNERRDGAIGWSRDWNAMGRGFSYGT